MKKKKWEVEYEKYANSNELQERVEYLQDLINGKVALKEEYEEYKKLSKLNENLPKVKNILELRETLNKQNEEIKKEIEKRNTLSKTNKAIQDLEQEMEQLEKEHSELEDKMKDKNLSKEEKLKIQQQIKENANKRQENNVKFGNYQDLLKSNPNEEENEYHKMTIEELKDNSSQLYIKISKCNLACSRLMKGYSWKSVELALDKYKDQTLKASKENAKKMKQNREVVKQQTTKQAPETLEVEENKEDEKSLTVKEEKTSFFSKIKARFADNKVVKFITEKLGLNKDNEKELGTENVEFKKQKSVEEKAEQEQKTVSKEDEFRKYLREVAEKGISGIEQEKAENEKQQKEAKMKAAREKLEANREESLKKEAERNNTNER